MGTKLEDFAVNGNPAIPGSGRNKLLANNVYNDTEDANNYNASNSRAISDQQTPIHGKGTGAGTIEGAVLSGGGDEDINGNVNVPGSGRIKLMATNTFNPTNNYMDTFPGVSPTSGIVDITAGGLTIAK